MTQNNRSEPGIGKGPQKRESDSKTSSNNAGMGSKSNKRNERDSWCKSARATRVGVICSASHQLLSLRGNPATSPTPKTWNNAMVPPNSNNNKKRKRT